MKPQNKLLRSSVLAGLSSLAVCHAAFGQGIKPADEKVVVTGSPIVRSADRFSKIISVVDRQGALVNGGASLGDALAQVPGITGTGFAPGANRPVIRGFDASRVLVTENGVGSQDVADIGPDHGTPIDILSADKIEIVRGAATLRYGSQAIGGIVNVLNQRIPDRVQTGIKGELAAIYGFNANAGNLAAQLNGGTGAFGFHADGFVRRDEDYDTPDGVQINSYADMQGFSLGGAGIWDAGSLGAAFNRYEGQYGLPSGDTFIDVIQDKLSGRGIWRVNAGALQRISLEAGGSNYEHSEIEPGGTVASTFINKEREARIEGIFGNIGPASDVAVGLQIQHRDFSALGEAADFLLPATAESVAGYVFAKFPLSDKLELEASARIESAAREGTPLSGIPTSNSYTPVSVAAGLVWVPSTDMTVGFTASSAARVPALTELFAIGPHDGPLTYETGDPNLDLERSNSLEATVRYDSGTIELNGALWGSWYDGFIFGELTGNLCDETGDCTSPPGAELKELNSTQRGADFWGLEAEAKAKLWTIDDVDAGVSMKADYVRGELDNGLNVPRLPPLRYGVGAFLEGSNISASLRLTQVDRQDKVSAFETPTPGYQDVSGDVTWRAFTDGEQSFDIALVLRNMTDQRQRNAASFVKDDILAPGRDFRIVGRWVF